MLEGNFHVITDHKLIYAFKRKSDQMSLRQIHQLFFILEFITDVRHVSDAENIVANALSRVDTIMPTNLDMQEIPETQASDDELQITETIYINVFEA